MLSLVIPAGGKGLDIYTHGATGAGNYWAGLDSASTVAVRTDTTSSAPLIFIANGLIFSGNNGSTESMRIATTGQRRDWGQQTQLFKLEVAGTASTTVLNVVGNINNATLTASSLVMSDAGKNLSSVPLGSVVIIPKRLHPKHDPSRWSKDYWLLALFTMLHPQTL